MMKCALIRLESCAEKVCRNRRESVLILEKKWAHGCCHICFSKSCCGGQHALLVLLVGDRVECASLTLTM